MMALRDPFCVYRMFCKAFVLFLVCILIRLKSELVCAGLSHDDVVVEIIMDICFSVGQLPVGYSGVPHNFLQAE